MTGALHIETLGELRLITLDRGGRRNALSRALLQELSAAVLAATREGASARSTSA